MPVYDFNNPEEVKAYKKTLPPHRWNFEDEKQALEYALLRDTRAERVEFVAYLRKHYKRSVADKLVAALKELHAQVNGRVA